MIINKVINNNVLSTHDENNREIVLMGKGIGFQKKVGDEVAEDKIEKKFVLDSEDEVGKFSELIEMIPHNYLNLSVDIISYAQQVMPKRLSPSIYISLTDHINFLLERSKENYLKILYLMRLRAFTLVNIWLVKRHWNLLRVRQE